MESSSGAPVSPISNRSHSSKGSSKGGVEIVQAISVEASVPEEQLTIPPLPPPPPISSSSCSSSPVSNAVRSLALSAQMQAPGMPTPPPSTSALDTEMMAASPMIMPPPLREEPTLKEKLVERERQRRVETERARLKRQFALMSHGGGMVYENAATSNSSQVAVRENGSVAGTVGEESTVAHAELEDEAEDRQESGQQLGYTMERFLLERGSVDPDPDPDASSSDTNADAPSSRNNVTAAAVAAAIINPTTVAEEPDESAESTATDKGVVMERFLNEPVHVEPAAPATQEESSSINAHNVHRSVSFDMELRHQQGPDSSSDPDADINQGGHSRSQGNTSMLLATGRTSTPPQSDDGLNFSVDSNVDSNASVKVEVADDLAQSSSLHSRADSPLASIDRQSSSSVTTPASFDQPRVLRLTEAEIQEMAAIEEASIGNAPPSERGAESLPGSSLVGELLGDFPGPNAPMTFSQGTPTTAMESVSIVSGGGIQSGVLQSNRVIIDQQSIDDVIATASVSSHLAVSPGGSIGGGSAVSVTANPPSEIVEPPPVLDDDDIISPVATLQASVNDDDDDNDDIRSDDDDRKPPALHQNAIPSNDLPSSNNGGCDFAAGPEGIVNRRIRPGMVERVERDNEAQGADLMSAPLEGKRSASLPEKIDEIVDDFDFDKHNEPTSPRSLLSDSLRDLPGEDNWPGVEGKMTLSPLNPRTATANLDLPFGNRRRMNRNEIQGIAADPPGRITTETESHTLTSLPPPPLVTGAAKAQIRREQDSTPVSRVPPEIDVHMGLMDTLFRYIQLDNNSLGHAYIMKSDFYAAEAKAGQERLFSLLATCLVELPVLSILLGGSDRLCMLIGRHRYQLVIGFIPLVCAITGNLSVQASKLTTSAIFHKQITSQSFGNWFKAELATSALLGLKMGAILGLFAFIVSGKDFLLALTIMVAQFTSSVSAGCTGTVAPLILAYFFNRNVGKWMGLVTTFQDMVGCFTMVLVSYHIFLFLGPLDSSVNSLDVCGPVDNGTGACVA